MNNFIFNCLKHKFTNLQEEMALRYCIIIELKVKSVFIVEIILNSSKDKNLLNYAFLGIGCCLYHLKEYEYALRCFLKVKETPGE